MNQTNPNDPLRLLQHQAECHQPQLADFSYLRIKNLNYYYLDWNRQTFSCTGTDATWLHHILETPLKQALGSRLKLLCHLWADNPVWQQAYQDHQRQTDQPTWLKTDFCLEGKHGYHLLEVEHENPLTIDHINPIFDCISYFKYENIRFQQNHPELQWPLAEVIAAPKLPKMPDELFFDLDAIIEADPEPLNEQEEQALSLRLQWHSDDEVAQKMGLSLQETRQLYTSIADKHHHTEIPSSVYQNYRNKLFASNEPQEQANPTNPFIL